MPRRVRAVASDSAYDLLHEKSAMSYGPTTAAAVLTYKTTHVPPIINHHYQDTSDDIVGQMTIRALDNDLRGTPLPSRNAVADRAFTESRDSLRLALRQLRNLRSDIRALPASSDPAFNAAVAALLTKYRRNIAVLAKRLLLVPPDTTSTDFRDALNKVIDLCERNLRQGKTILAAGTTGLCDPSNPRNAGALAHTWTADGGPLGFVARSAKPHFTDRAGWVTHRGCAGVTLQAYQVRNATH